MTRFTSCTPFYGKLYYRQGTQARFHTLNRVNSNKLNVDENSLSQSFNQLRNAFLKFFFARKEKKKREKKMREKMRKKRNAYDCVSIRTKWRKR